MGLFIRLFIVVALQALLSRFLISMGITNVFLYYGILCFGIAILFTVLNYPIKKFSVMIKDSRFHSQILKYFLMFYAIDLIIYFLF